MCFPHICDPLIKSKMQQVQDNKPRWSLDGQMDCFIKFTCLLQLMKCTGSLFCFILGTSCETNINYFFYPTKNSSIVFFFVYLEHQGEVEQAFL